MYESCLKLEEANVLTNAIGIDTVYLHEKLSSE